MVVEIVPFASLFNWIHILHYPFNSRPRPSTENPNKFKGFQELYGIKCTSEQYCPSLKKQLCGVDGIDINIKLSGETIRDFVKCIDCNKPRGIYSAKKLIVDQKRHLEVLKEECVYTRSGILVPEDHELFGTVFVQPNVTCSAPVVSPYFVARSTFKSVCFHCEDEDIFPISDKLKKNFQSVHPVCNSCKRNGVNERTRGARSLKRKP